MSWGRTRCQVIDINRTPKIKIPRLRKRQHNAPGSLSQLSPREAERLRDGYDSTPDPAYSCLRCSAQRQTATWLLYRVLYSLLAGCSVCHFAHARPTMPSISLVGRAGASPPSRTAAIIFLYIIYIYPCRTSCPKSSTCFFFSDISIFIRRKCYTLFFSPIFQYFLTCMPCAMDSSAMDSSALDSSAMDSSAMESSSVDSSAMESSIRQRSYSSQKKRKGSRPSRS